MAIFFYLVTTAAAVWPTPTALQRGNEECVELYRGADKSLARPDWKNNWKFVIFRPTRRSLLPRRPGWTDNLLNCFWVACRS